MSVMYRAGERKTRPGAYRRFENTGTRNANISHNNNGNSQNDFPLKHSHITLIDTSSPSKLYKIAVTDGKLTMSQNASEGGNGHIALIDTNNPSKLYVLTVTNGKLTMSQNASEDGKGHITLIDTNNPSKLYNLAVTDGNLTMGKAVV